MMQRTKLAELFLTAGLVTVLGVFGAQKLYAPDLWIGWMPSWLDGLFGLTKARWLTFIGLGELLMAVLVLFPVRIVRRIGAGLMVLHLLTIVVQVGWNDIGIRDIGLLTAAMALLALL